MSLRARIATTAAVAVVVAVALVGTLVLVSTTWRVRRQLDQELLQVARQLQPLPADALARALDDDPPPGRRGGRLLDRLPPDFDAGRLLGPLGGGVVRVTTEDLRTVTFGGAELTSSATVGRIANNPRAEEPPYFRTALTVEDDQPVRVVALPLDRGGAVEVAAAADVDEPALTALRRQLGLAGLLGGLLAAGLGLLVADRAVRPVRRLTETAEQVGRTGDLGTRIDVVGDDEVARLATSFNAMLASLGQARSAQQQLVADASHELRTPLTSLRTNLEVLQLDAGDPHDARLDPAERTALLRDLTLQLEEMGRLVDGLVELARGDGPARSPTRVVLGDLVADVVERVGLFHGDADLSLERDGSVVVGEVDRLERAVSNLVDNAVKHGGGAPVEVVVADGAVVVRDHGPGIPPDDLPRVFERFYRAPASRALPGSGLGLSIVAQVAAAHGGQVAARNHPDGGTEVTLRLPTA